jgi:hypothetical protein
MLKNWLVISLLMVIMLSGSAYCDDQSKTGYSCAACGEPIIKTAAVIEGKLYHPECFRCITCDKQIDGEYLKDSEGQYYHPECFEQTQLPNCAHCKKTITEGNYITYQGQAYHPECYRRHVAPSCDVCGKSLEGSYVTDYWGNHFHSSHIDEYPVCTVCGRLAWQRDRVQLDEKQWLCSVCAVQSVTSPEQTRRLLEEVRDELSVKGISVVSMRIRIELVENTLLAAGREPDLHSHVLGHITWKEGQIPTGDESAIINVLKGLPEDFMKGIIAHELMHAWQHENNASDLPLKLREGSANFASSLIYLEMHTPRAQFFMEGLNVSKDPIYGEGYRQLSKFAQQNGVLETLSMLKRESKNNKK